MKSNISIFFTSSNWNKLLLIMLLLLAFGLSSTIMAQQAVKYKIETWTGKKNGTNKPVSILMMGTLRAMDDPIILDNPRVDDFKRGAKDEFIVDALDMGVITDIMFKAHPQDYWKVDKVQITRLGRDGKPLKPGFTSEWDGNFPKLIDGNFPKGNNKWVRASNIEKPKTDLIGQGVDTLIRQEAHFADNLNGRDGKDKCESYDLIRIISDGFQSEQSSSTSFTATFGAAISAGVEGIFTAEASYGFEVSTSISKTFSNVETIQGDRVYAANLCASPGTIKIQVNNLIETRQYGEVSFVGGSERFFKVIDARWRPEGGELVRTYQEVDAYLENPASDPELGRAINLISGTFNLKPRSKSLPPIYFGNNVDNVTEKGNTQPQPKVEKSTTSQVEVCDNSGNVVGYFKKNGNGWVETDTNGNTKFRFQETNKNQGVIYLSDTGRPGVKINLDLNNKEVLYSDQNNTTPFSIYIISKVK